MKVPNRYLLSLLALLLTQAIWGQEGHFIPVTDAAGLIKEITAANQQMVSLQSEFEQEKAISFLEEVVYSSGKFYYQKKDKIRWEYEKPYSYLIIMNGSIIRIRDGEKTIRQDASSSRLFSSINAVMTGIIDGSALGDVEYFRSTFQENESQVRVDLVPVMPGMKDFIASMEVYLDQSDLGVSAIKIIEKTGDYTFIRFTNKRPNASIPEALFIID